VKFVEARRRNHAVDESPCAGWAPEFAMMNEHLDLDRAGEQLQAVADAPPGWKTAPVAARGTFKDNASRHGRESGEGTLNRVNAAVK